MALKIKLHENRPIVEQDISEMARVGFADKLEVSVWTDDGGEVPHVHITNKEPPSKSTSINLCVQLEKSEYFTHGKYKGSLNASQRKEFNDFMHRPHRAGKFDSNYEYAVLLWNDNNSTHEITLQKDANGKVIVPDYTTIERYKPIK